MTAVFENVLAFFHYLFVFVRTIGWFDYCCAGVFVFVLHRAIHRGFSGELARAAGLTAGALTGYAGYRCFDSLMALLGRTIPKGLPVDLSVFLMVLAICVLVWSGVENFFAARIHAESGTGADLVGGAILGVYKALLIISLVCCTAAAQPDHARIRSLERNSWTFRNINRLIGMIVDR